MLKMSFETTLENDCCTFSTCELNKYASCLVENALNLMQIGDATAENLFPRLLYLLDNFVAARQPFRESVPKVSLSGYN